MEMKAREAEARELKKTNTKAKIAPLESTDEEGGRSMNYSPVLTKNKII